MKFIDIIKSLAIGFPLTAISIGLLFLLFSFISMKWLSAILFSDIGMFIRATILVWICLSTIIYIVEYYEPK